VPLAAPLRPASCSPGEMSDTKLATLVYGHARCARLPVDPDQWFPVSGDTAKAREEASAAIAVCSSCPVRAQCLELAFRHNPGFGAHGVWGGLVEGERHLRRRRWRHGVAVTELL
jgi:WhiB family transcriptional regulator, redox-sensing transcriptional regulator